MARPGDAQELEIEGRRVRVTNPAKVLFPTGFTKGQAIDFYIRVSDYLLPHVAGRPVTLKRYPNGIRAKHFYEKNAPRYTPGWIRTFAVPRRAGGPEIHYVLLNDLASVVWAANLANIEIHPFLCRVPEIQRPSFVVFDLDPGEGADILTCAEVGFLLKRALERAGLESFAKTSGSKGMQIYAPLNTAVTYAETQPFARSLAESLERDHPELVVAAMAKAERQRKIFIDWSQNSDFKTTVAVYSMRAKSDAPYVSMPVAWGELRQALRKRDPGGLYFEPDAALRRLARKGDLFAPLLSLKQGLPGRARQAGG
ncbi:MAG: non-homologous end-joining DNA ligase [Acidobacteriia bacterium]|nr:non-homologous end-joining DNA ligase [Terriglobia bacterium]